MTPDRAPTVHELLAFYLEAGVDCALMDEPVNRVSEESAAASRDRPPLAPVRSAPAAMPPVRAEPAPAPEVAIQSAREAARTAPSLEVLRAML